MEYNTDVSGRLRVMPIVAVQRKNTMLAGRPIVTLLNQYNYNGKM